MRRRSVWLAIVAVVALASHMAVIAAAPNAIMAIALKRISGDGRAVNRWVFGPRTTEASRGVVRPSPDLAYASCVYDLTRAPLRVTAEPSPADPGGAGGYLSVAVYAANTDNIFTLGDRQAPQGIDFVLARPGQAVPPGARVVRSPSARGVVLQRRLAPTAQRFAQVDQARRGDQCAPAGVDFPARR